MARAAPESGSFRLRKMTGLDLPEIAAMESSTFPDPWPVSSFLDCLNLGYACWAFAQDSSIQAYAIMALEPDNAHLLNLCVHDKSRRRGLGRLLLDHLVSLARARDVSAMFLEVRSSNEAAIQLYESMGFAKVGLRHGYYPGSSGGEDAIVMARHL